jgi:DNA repair protein RecN (Recombination protein N)
MRNARFAVAFERLAEPTATGNESVQYVLSPNKGEPMRPLGKVASGGELSRLLLALAVVLADKRDAATLVFDEIDAGVGGATAAAVGTRLGALAKRSQVVCVTHLAQIASWAAGHYALRKRDRRGGTAIEAVALDAKAAVVEELARMLSGSTSDVALQHAGQLLAATEAGAASKGSSRPR